MYDCIVIGSGIAGLYTALLAQSHGRVLLLTKARLDDSNTNNAQGGIAAAVGTDDRPELQWRDTLEAGAGLSDPLASWVLVVEGPERIADLVSFGVPFDREGGHLALGREGAHTRARVLHAGGDATGARVQATLGHLVGESRNVTIREHSLVTDLVLEDGAVRGVIAVDHRSGLEERYTGRAVVLATGGAGQLYAQTTNPAVASGTGLALAYRAGASLADLEFIQFHPTALMLNGAPRFLISEAARGAGAVLRDRDGRRFMFDYDPRGELAPRHVVAGAILTEMTRQNTACVYLDLSGLPEAETRQHFPTIAEFCDSYDLDITRRPIPVAPAAHYVMGGVRTNLWGETDLPGLFACGEVACTGVHGANRLASNSLLEALVFGSRIVRRMVAGSGDPDRGAADPSGPMPQHGQARIVEDHRVGPSAQSFPHPQRQRDQAGEEQRPPAVLMKDVQELMWANVGMVRSRESLEAAQRRLDQWTRELDSPSSPGDHELRALLLVARLVTTAALVREESRGGHRRSDYPDEDDAWLRRVVFRAPVEQDRLAKAGARHHAEARID